jgi:hypothetical protein
MNLLAMVLPTPLLFSKMLAAAADAKKATRQLCGCSGIEYSLLTMMNMPGVKMRSASSDEGWASVMSSYTLPVGLESIR